MWIIYTVKLFDYYISLLSIFWEVSNYNFWPMEKKNFSILLILVFLTSSSDSDDYNYDDYAYDEYNYYDERYDYYGDQNLPAPAPIPIFPPTPSHPPPPPPQPPIPPPQTGNYIFLC